MIPLYCSRWRKVLEGLEKINLWTSQRYGNETYKNYRRNYKLPYKEFFCKLKPELKPHQKTKHCSWHVRSATQLATRHRGPLVFTDKIISSSLAPLKALVSSQQSVLNCKIESLEARFDSLCEKINSIVSQKLDHALKLLRPANAPMPTSSSAQVTSSLQSESNSNTNSSINTKIPLSTNHHTTVH